jgi:hypothetical protein
MHIYEYITYTYPYMPVVRINVSGVKAKIKESTYARIDRQQWRKGKKRKQRTILQYYRYLQ